MLPLLRSGNAAELDLISINAYDARLDFDPMESFHAYRRVWPGRLALGVEVRLRGGAGPFHSAAKAEALAREITKDRGGVRCCIRC
jgi:chitinase